MKDGLCRSSGLLGAGPVRSRSTLAATAGLTIAALLMVPEMAQAQADPGAQAAQDAEDRARALEEAARPRMTGPGVIADALTPGELPPPGGPTVVLRQITFEPSSAFLTAAELEAIRARYLGRRLDFRGISMLVAEINELYAERGVVTAAAVLQPQDIQTGDLVVTLVEGQVGVVAIAGETQNDPEYFFDRIRFARGTTVDVPTASEDIAWFNQTSRAQVRLLLQPGAAFGMTDLFFGVTEPPPHTLQFFLDNNGVESTGEFRASVLYRRYGLWGRDDTLLAFLEGSEGSLAGTLRYDFPVTTSGTRLAFTYTQSDVKVIAGPSLPLDIRGNSRSFAMNVTQPFVANERWLVQGILSGFTGESRSFSAGVPVVDARTEKLGAGVSVGFTGERGVFNTQAQMISARVNDRLAPSVTRYRIATGSYDARYSFDNGLTFLGRGAWQYSRSDLLPGGLLFNIGGPTTVRGFPSDGVAGDSGFYTNWELHRAFDNAPRPASGFIFADFGEVYSTFPAVTSMASVGIGATYDFTPNTRLEVTAAFPVRKAVANQSSATLSAVLTVSRF